MTHLRGAVTEDTAFGGFCSDFHLPIQPDIELTDFWRFICVAGPVPVTDDIEVT